MRPDSAGGGLGIGQALVQALGSLVTMVCGLAAVFVVYGTIVMLKRTFGQEPARGKGRWINIYTVLAAVSLILGVAGVWGNVKFLIEGAGVPSDAAARGGFVGGMFVVPAFFLILSLVLVLLAARKVSEGDSQRAA